MTYQFEWEPEGVCLTISGATSGNELDEALDQIRHHPELQKLKYVIADYLAVEDFPVTTHEVLSMAVRDNFWLSITNANLKIALVGNKTEVLEAFRRYAEISVIGDTFTVRTFARSADARRWVATGR